MASQGIKLLTSWTTAVMDMVGTRVCTCLRMHTHTLSCDYICITLTHTCSSIMCTCTAHVQQTRRCTVTTRTLLTYVITCTYTCTCICMFYKALSYRPVVYVLLASGSEPILVVSTARIYIYICYIFVVDCPVYKICTSYATCRGEVYYVNFP